MGRRQRARARARKSVTEHEDSENASNFIDLCKHLGSFGWSNETRLVVKHFPETGRGLCSKNFIPENGVLIRIPFDALITLKTLEEDDVFRNFMQPIIDNLKKQVDFQVLLSIYILFHKHLELSPHKAYIDSIPPEFTNPFFCSKAELMFVPDNILQSILAQNEAIKSGYNLFKRSFDSFKCECCGGSFEEIFKLSDFKWIYFAINSRCVYVNPDAFKEILTNTIFPPLLNNAPNLALAPLLDLLNHSDSAQTCMNLSIPINEIKQTKDKGIPIHYELITKVEYRKYEQVFISYDKHPNQKLLIEYGFFIPDNKHEIFYFTMPDIEAFTSSGKNRHRIFHKNKFKTLREHNFEAQMFVHPIEGFSHNLLVVLYILFKEASHFPNNIKQVAFGSQISLSCVYNEAMSLLHFKIVEYENIVKNLKALPTLSSSGSVLLGYMLECIKFLQSCANKLI